MSRARVERRTTGLWDVFFDGWRTTFANEYSARSAAASFEAGEQRPDDYSSHRALPYGPEFQDQDAHNAGNPAPHTAPMTHTAAMAHKIADLEAATHIGTTVAAELARWRKIDRAAKFGGEAWHDATRRLRDVADRLEDAPEVDDAGVTS